MIRVSTTTPTGEDRDFSRTLRDTVHLTRLIEEVMTLNVSERLTAQEILTDADAYRMRYVRIPLFYGNMIAIMKEGQVLDCIQGSLHEHERQLHLTADNGEWEVVAWHVIEEERVLYFNEPQAPDMTWNLFSGKAKPPNNKKVAKRRPYFCIEVAFVDTLMNPETCNLKERQGIEGSPMDRYTKLGDTEKERDKKYLPKAYRAQRQKGLTLLKDFADFHVEEAKPVKHALNNDQIEIADRLNLGGTKWGDIAKLLGVPWQTVRRAVHEKRGLEKVGEHETDSASAGNAA